MKHQARKRFGQHFLSDSGIIDAIVRAIAPRAGDAMVEIGPGLAALTQPLVERTGRLTVIELDRDLAVRLRQHPQLQVIESDVLRVDFRALVQQFEAARGRFGSEGFRPMQEALRTGNIDEARRLNNEKVAPLYEDVRKNISDLVDLQFDEAKKEYNASVSLFETIRMVAIAMLVLSIVMSPPPPVPVTVP